MARGSPRSGSYSTPKSSTSRLDAFDLDELDETFDLVLCFGILHRVENPLGLLKILRRRLAGGGRVLLETLGTADRALDSSAAVHVLEPGEVYAHDDFVYWGFTPGALGAMARHAGFEGFELIDAPVIDGHRRVIGVAALRSARLSAGRPGGSVHGTETPALQGVNSFRVGS